MTNKRSTFKRKGGIKGNQNAHIFGRRNMRSTASHIQWLRDERRKKTESDLRAIQAAEAKRRMRGRAPQEVGAWA